MATFQILEDVENIPIPKRNLRFLGVAEKCEVFAKKNNENRILQPINGTRQESKRMKLSNKENDVIPQIKEVVEKVKEPRHKNQKVHIIEKTVLDEDLLKLEIKESPVVPKEEDSFPFSHLHPVEYRMDIWNYLIQMEVTCQTAKSNYMSKQASLSWNTRSILVDWLVSVSEEFKLSDQTFHLGINYIDRFLTRFSVTREKFQLLGAAAMMIAGKVEEVYPVEISEWSYLTGDAFSVRQLLKMEQMILKVLEFGMQPPTVYSFIEHICTQFNFDSKTMHLAMFLSEIMVLEGEDYLDHPPSKLASASIASARYMLSKNQIWPKQLKQVSGYSLKQLSPVVQRQHRSLRETPLKNQQAIQKKYKSEKYNGVAKLKPKVLNLNDFETDE